MQDIIKRRKKRLERHGSSNQPWVKELQKIQNQWEDMNQAQRNDGLNLENVVNQVDSLFIEEVMLTEIPPKFKLPVIKAYDGTKDPVGHLDTFWS